MQPRRLIDALAETEFLWLSKTKRRGAGPRATRHYAIQPCYEQRYGSSCKRTGSNGSACRAA